MKREIDHITNGLHGLIKLYSEFPALKDGDPTVYICAYSAFRIGFQCEDKTREATLAAIGEILGRDGWTTKESHTGKSLNWTKTIYDVEISINDAQLLERPPIGFPVPPSAFPLMIQDQEP